ncbi:MAG TPA: TPM domain-containing protein [Chitinophagaceae bacterium]|nr:TPM domain-containing protein [Chitinophagaceae bacterium]HNF72838.1 TPM domain-containing protein [Chitinophagaceae bacterium]
MRFLFRKKNPFLSPDDIQQITECIREQEKRSSGEIRLFIEEHCSWIEAGDRARVLFQQLKMTETSQHNALLIYIASADKQFAILGDTAIFQLAPADFWNQQSQALAGTFREGRFKYGICQCIEQCGNLLATYFPPRENQKNELPDEIIFGK